MCPRGVAMFGLGLAVAVMLDATLMRMLLVPATMEPTDRRAPQMSRR